MFNLFERYYIKSSKGDNKLYVSYFNTSYDDVTWTAHIELAYYRCCQSLIKDVFIKLRDNEFPVCLVRRWWWFGWHEEKLM